MSKDSATWSPDLRAEAVSNRYLLVFAKIFSTSYSPFFYIILLAYEEEMNFFR
jgi:hypothetical protein